MTTHYFSPGPATLPGPVRERVARELLDTFGLGVSIMEISHRSSQYAEVNARAHASAKRLLGVPDTHELFFTPFGAQQHFCLLLQQLTLPGDVVAYTDTGVWAHIAVKEAKASGRDVVVVYDGQPDYVELGTPSAWHLPPRAKFLHLTVNNTVYGTEYPSIPSGLGVDLVLDMTSSIAARSDIPWNETSMIYASAQKNFGIAGCSLVILRKDVLEASRAIAKANRLGNALTYASFFDAKSILNTPPCFPIYVAACYFEWMEEQGGLPAMEARALEKARLVYDQVDGGLYVGRAVRPFRSRHNFVFDLPRADLVEAFIQEAGREGLLEIKGYRTTGGVRCSMYNGVSVPSARTFADFMADFRRRRG
jgi:phosphoserine aminotransferase